VREDRIALADLGDALGIAFQQVQKYEKGTNRIGASRLQHIAHAGCPRCSGSFLPASPPSEKAAACTHKTRQSSAGDGAGRSSCSSLRIILETASWLNATPAFANPRATRAASVPEPTSATDLTPARVNDRQGHSAQSLSQGGEAPAMRPYRPRRQAHNRGRPVLKPRPSTGCLKSIRREAASSAARTTRSTANFWLSMKPPDS
jgi:transcriptional regulator with XRE-family HTH domain